MILDTELIRRRRVELRFMQRQIAARLCVSGGVIRGLEDAVNHADISVGLLTRLAEALAVDVADLISADRQIVRREPADDAAAIGAFLHASETLTPITAVAELLGWDNARLEAAIAELDTNLRTCGLRLHRINGQLTIARAIDAAARKTVREATRTHLLRAGLSVTEARLLRRISKGGTLKELSNANQVALGVLSNAGLLNAGSTSTSSDVQYSLMFEGSP